MMTYMMLTILASVKMAILEFHSKQTSQTKWRQIAKRFTATLAQTFTRHQRQHQRLTSPDTCLASQGTAFSVSARCLTSSMWDAIWNL